MSDFTFEATCGVCDASYEHADMPSEGSLRGGTFCPACKDRRRMAPGILHWEYHSVVADYLSRERAK